MLLYIATHWLPLHTSYAMLSSGIPWNIRRVICIFWYTHVPLGECLYQENTSDESDIPRNTTRKRCITLLYHSVENTVASKASIINAKYE